MRRILTALLALGLVLAACGDDADVSTDTSDDGGSDKDPGRPVGRTEYRSVEVTADGEPRPLVPDTVIALHVGDDGTIGASLGCNSLGGTFSLVDDDDGSVLVLGDGLSMTEMGCDPERHAQDDWFAALLASRPTFDLAGDTLTLSGTVEGVATTVVLRERSVVDPDRPLEGTPWSVTGFLDGDVAMAFGDGQAATISFDATTSEASGSDGCTTFTVPYEVDGDDVRFGTPTFAEPDCAGGEYTERFRAVLVERVAVDVQADALTLVDEATGQGVTFRTP